MKDTSYKIILRYHNLIQSNLSTLLTYFLTTQTKRIVQSNITPPGYSIAHQWDGPRWELDDEYRKVHQNKISAETRSWTQKTVRWRKEPWRSYPSDGSSGHPITTVTQTLNDNSYVEQVDKLNHRSLLRQKNRRTSRDNHCYVKRIDKLRHRALLLRTNRQTSRKDHRYVDWITKTLKESRSCISTHNLLSVHKPYTYKKTALHPKYVFIHTSHLKHKSRIHIHKSLNVQKS